MLCGGQRFGALERCGSRGARCYLRFYLRNVARRSETTAAEALAKRLVGGGA
jgi:hypothetical protein